MMKTLFTAFFATIVIMLACANSASSQIIEVCGTDTITLRAGNYQYGTMRWEKSIDMETWEVIPNEVDTVYSFLPNQTMYYRCVSKFPDCPPEASQISLVRMPPVANAGVSRVVFGTQVRLAANQEEDETGQWTIIEGNGGTLSDSTSPAAILQGIDNETYTLLWTLGNACGSSTDTLEVEFVTNQYFDNFVVVDTTDVILSNEAQLADGEYVIQFSPPAPAVADSTVLIGMQLGGFLRMVQSVLVNVENNDTIYTMQTTQATLEDITEYGAFNFGEIYSLDTTLTDDKSAGYRRLSRMPTRQELQNNEKFRSGEIHYYLLGEKTSKPEGVSMHRSRDKSGSSSLSFNFESAKIVDAMGVEIMLSGSYQYVPNLVADRKTGWLGGTNYFKLGTSNSRENKKITLNVDVNATVTLLDREFTVYENTVYYLVIVGGVPMLLDITFKLNGKAGAEAGLMMSAEPSFEQETVSSNYIEYKNGSWGVTRETRTNTKSENDYEVTGGLKQTFEIGPEVSFNIYTVVGPYISYKLEQELVLCTSLTSPPFDWAVNVEIGGEGKLGAKGTIFGKEFIDYYVSWKTDKWKYTFPYSMEITRGNHMSYVPDSPPQERQIPVQVTVHGNKDFHLPMAKVIFEPDSTCSVGDSPPGSPHIVYANVHGVANTTWIPGNPSVSRLKANVLDCNGSHIKNSPLEFVAYADDECIGSNLSASLLFLEDNTLSVEGKLGQPPYLYSLDGGAFAGTAPTILPEAHTLYTFTVKDSLECETSVIYKAPDPCDKYNITVDYAIYPDSLYVFDAQGGTPPYLFSLNPDSLFSANNTFANLQSGFHVVYAKDSLGCVGYVEIGEEAVQICGQIWMKHNLAVDIGNNWWPQRQYCVEFQPNGWCKKYEWREHTEYGRLYDWATVMNGEGSSYSNPSGVQGICPAGWHVPSDAEWTQLINCLGGQGVAGGKLKSTATGARIQVGIYSYLNPDGHPFWYEPNTAATDEVGFSALPGGVRWATGSFSRLGTNGYWWSSTEYSSSSAWARYLYHNYGNVNRYSSDKTYGFSLRCVRDN